MYLFYSINFLICCTVLLIKPYDQQILNFNTKCNTFDNSVKMKKKSSGRALETKCQGASVTLRFTFYNQKVQFFCSKANQYRCTYRDAGACVWPIIVTCCSGKICYRRQQIKKIVLTVTTACINTVRRVGTARGCQPLRVGVLINIDRILVTGIKYLSGDGGIVLGPIFSSWIVAVQRAYSLTDANFIFSSVCV